MVLEIIVRGKKFEEKEENLKKQEHGHRFWGLEKKEG